MHDKVIRTCDAIRGQLVAYEMGAIGLRQLIANLEVFLTDPNLKDLPSADTLRAYWEELEVLYAVARDQGLPAIRDVDEPIARKIVAEMHRCLSSMIAK